MLASLLSYIKNIYHNVDWLLFGAIIPVLIAGLLTMNSFVSSNYYFDKQLISIGISLVVFFILSGVDFRFLRRTSVILSLFIIACGLLLGLEILGTVSKGAQSWFDFGSFSFEPSDPIKIILILLLAKYFSRRHIEIANIKHILISGFYSAILFVFIAIHPDFGSAIIIFCIWLGMVLFSGISKKHLFVVASIGAVAFGLLWVYGFKDYQRARIVNFLHPLANIRGSGYNAYQSTIAVGSGQIIGKGIGYGTQSRLNFLPEHQTDFIFAAYAEEWGFVGSVLLLIFFSIIIWRVIANGLQGGTNFEVFYGLGLAILFSSHLIINIGMNIGLMPITGITIPFMSYGGSHVLTEFAALGILMGMRRYRRTGERSLGFHEISDIKQI